jgi:hypothetical protein
MKTSSKKKPIYVAKSGSVKIPVYYSLDKGKYPSYRVAYYNSEGKRKLVTLADRAAAIAHADSLAAGVSLGTMASAPALTPKEVAEFHRLKGLESSLGGRTLWDFCTNSAIPAQLTLETSGFSGLLEAATYYVRGFKGKKKGKTVSEAIDDFLFQKEPVLAKATFPRLRRCVNKLRAVYGNRDIRELELSDVALLINVLSGRVPPPANFPLSGPLSKTSTSNSTPIPAAASSPVATQTNP